MRLELGPHLETCFRHFILFTLVGGWVADYADDAEGGVRGRGSRMWQRGATRHPSDAPPALSQCHLWWLDPNTRQSYSR